MPNLRDQAILHAIFLERLKSHEVNEALKLLAVTQTELLLLIQQRIANIASRGYDTSIVTTRRLNFLAIAIAKILDEGYIRVEEKLFSDLGEIAVAETKGAISPKILLAIAFTRPMIGQLIKDYFRTLRVITKASIVRDIQSGLVLGEDTPEILGRVRDTLKLRFNTQVATITRTAVTHVTAQARELVWAKDKKVEAVQWISTLDTRTSDICISLDGQIFPVGEGIRPPAHLNCRSTTIPVLIGQPASGRITYLAWLKRQNVKVQNQVLGKQKGTLFRAGKLKFDRPIYNGRPMTLAELGAIENA